MTLRRLGGLLPDRLSGRIVLVLLLGLTVLHIGSLWLHQVDIETLLGTDREAQLAERLVGVRRVLAGLAPDKRDSAAHDLSSASLDLHWTEVATTRPARAANAHATAVRARVRELLDDITPDDFVLGPGDGAASHVLLGALRLPDATWLNFSAALFRPVMLEHATLLSTTAMAAGILMVALVVVRLIARPLRTLADAADRIGQPGPGVNVSEHGPHEVRQAARAFNRMQARITAMIADRTRALAAVSHDLRTPVARLRLRAGFVESTELQRQIDHDLDEIDTMIGSTLAYLRGDQDHEAARPVNLAAILETLCDDATDAGGMARYVGPGNARVLGRPVAVKRAFANLIDNAVQYAGETEVRLSQQERTITVRILDNGPGIPEAELESVFEPFHRLDVARRRAGSGLGLTIARQVVEGHGGKIRLENRAEGGLCATVSLPRQDGDRA